VKFDLATSLRKQQDQILLRETFLNEEGVLTEVRTPFESTCGDGTRTHCRDTARHADRPNRRRVAIRYRRAAQR